MQYCRTTENKSVLKQESSTLTVQLTFILIVAYLHDEINTSPNLLLGKINFLIVTDIY